MVVKFESANAQHLELMKKELNEDPKRMENNLRLLEEWIKCQTYLPQNYDRKILISFLRFTKQDLAKAKQKIEKFFMLINCNEGVFGHVSQNYLTNIDDYNTIIDSYICPELTANGRRLTIWKMKDVENGNVSPNFYIGFYYQLTLRLFIDTPRLGDEYIMDIGNFHAKYLPAFISSGFFHYIKDYEKLFPVRFGSIYVTRMNVIMEQLMKAVRPLMTKKLQDRFVYMKDANMTHIYPAEMLPSDFGGSKPSMSELNKGFMNLFKGHQPIFNQLENYKLNGPIPDKYKTEYDSGFGNEGSFRKLDLD